MTAVQSLPNLQSLPRLGWDSSGSAGQDNFVAEDVNRIGGGRKGFQRSNSSSSENLKTFPSTTVDSATTTESPGIIQPSESTAGSRFARNFWPVTKVELQPSIVMNGSNGRTISESAPNTISQNTQPGILLATPKVAQNPNQSTTNGSKMATQASTQETPALLILLPMNGTFERKQINVPLFPEMLRVGRQTNAKTIPTATNGYFDSKVLSRQHAEVWADRGGKIWIRDVKSSNGTFVNGVRLSPESRDSEPHELRENDMLELGIDIVSEDQKSIVHHKVSAKIEHAGLPTNATSVLDLNMGDIEPGSGGGLSLPLGNGNLPRRLSNSSAISSNGRTGYGVTGIQATGYGVQRYMGAWVDPVSIEQVVKRLTSEMRQARQQSQDLNRTGDFIHALLHVEPGQSPPKAPTDLFYSSPIANGIMPHKEHISPFSQPPAPPPQLPLPEKPTMSPSDRHNLNALKRNDAERSSPINGKIDPSSSQILQLVDALSSAKREIDRQGSRVRELEDELKQERKARQHGEERMRAFLDNLHTSNKNSADIDEISSIHSEGTILLGNRELGTVESVSASTTRLQERLDLMLQEMRGLKDQIEVYKHRAETAEEEKSGLADMVDQIRSGVAKTSPISRSPQTSRSTANRTELEPSIAVNGTATNTKLRDDSGDTEMNGMTDKSILHPTELQNLVTAAMSLHRDDRFMQSAPYASMVGVVLIGVGIMAYLNGWQKLETS